MLAISSSRSDRPPRRGPPRRGALVVVQPGRLGGGGADRGNGDVQALRERVDGGRARRPDQVPRGRQRVDRRPGQPASACDLTVGPAALPQPSRDQPLQRVDRPLRSRPGLRRALSGSVPVVRRPGVRRAARGSTAPVIRRRVRPHAHQPNAPSPEMISRRSGGPAVTPGLDQFVILLYGYNRTVCTPQSVH